MKTFLFRSHYLLGCKLLLQFHHLPRNSLQLLANMPSAAALIIPAVKKHTATVIMAHGLGDSGAGWVSLAENFRRRNKFEEVKFIFPNAPTIPITVVCTLPRRPSQFTDAPPQNYGMRMPGWYDIVRPRDSVRLHINSILLPLMTSQ